MKLVNLVEAVELKNYSFVSCLLAIILYVLYETKLIHDTTVHKAKYGSAAKYMLYNARLKFKENYILLDKL